MEPTNRYAALTNEELISQYNTLHLRTHTPREVMRRKAMLQEIRNRGIERQQEQAFIKWIEEQEQCQKNNQQP